MFEFVGVKYDEVNEATVASALLQKLNRFFLEIAAVDFVLKRAIKKY